MDATTKINLPPVICSLFVGTAFIGTYDNPYKLLDAIDIVIEKKFFRNDDIPSGHNLRLFFSVVNDTDISSTLYVKHEYIKVRSDIKKCFDEAIQAFIEQYDMAEDSILDKEMLFT